MSPAYRTSFSIGFTKNQEIHSQRKESLRLKAASITTAAILIVSMIIIISIAAYATVASSRSESTYTTCTETTSTYVPKNLTLFIPNAICANKISLEGFSLLSSGSEAESLRGTIVIETKSPLTTLMLFFNGAYVLSSPFPTSNESSYSTPFGASFSSNVPVISGQQYSVEFIALFQDGTATVNSTQVTAP